MAPLPYLAEAEAVVSAQAERRAQHTCGVSWGSLSPRPPEVEDVETVRQRIEHGLEVVRAYAQSPRGRAFRAFVDLDRIGYRDDLIPISQTVNACDRLCFNAEFLERHLSAQAVLAAIKVLVGIDHSSAREAVDALCDLGVETMRRAA